MQQQSIRLSEPFILESGEVIPNLEIAYHTYGKLNATKDNVIWACHALTANSALHDWWAGLFGPGKVFDPEKYFIVCANNLGSPYGTDSPEKINPATGKRYGLSFPDFTLRDTARLHLDLMDSLGIETIKLLIGGSCGGNISLEMAMMLDIRLQNLGVICCSAQEKPWTIGIHESQRMALESAPNFKINQSGTAKRALKAARAFALPFYRSAKSINQKQSETDLSKMDNFKVASYLNYQGEKFINRFDAHCYYKLLKALDTHNVGRGNSSIEKALGKISAKTLSIGIDSDLFIPIEEQQFLAEYIPGAEYVEVKSDYGHDAFLIEFDQLNRILLGMGI